MNWMQRTVVLTYYYLLRFSDFLENELSIDGFYQKCLFKVLKEGGDSSTNASLVGSMIGAAVGLTEIPVEMINKLLECSSSSKPRPDFVNTNKHLVNNVKNLVENIPSRKLDAIIFEIQK